MAARIALVHYTAPPVVGGVEVVLGAHARLFADAGHEVRIIAGRGRSTDPRIETATVALAGSRHPRVARARSALNAGRVPAGFDGLVRELVDTLEGLVRDVDMLIVHNVATLHFNLALTAALHKVGGRPRAPAIVTWNHDIAAAMPWYEGELHPGWPWDLVREPWPSATTVTISETRRADLVRVTGLAAEAIHVVPNGIDLEHHLRLHAATRRLIDRLELEAPGPILLTPSRLTPRKNVELALRVLAALRSSAPEARLIVTGAIDPHDASSRAYLERLEELGARLGLADSVAFLSEEMRSRDAVAIVRDLYQLADMLLVPSRDEGFGLPLIEAAVARLPIVCPAIPALVELAGNDATLFDPDASPADIARLIEGRLAPDPAYRFAARVRSNFTWSAIYRDRIAPLVEELVAGRR